MEDIKQKAYRLHQQGYSYREIGIALDLSKTAAFERVKEIKLMSGSVDEHFVKSRSKGGRKKSYDQSSGIKTKKKNVSPGKRHDDKRCSATNVGTIKNGVVNASVTDKVGNTGLPFFSVSYQKPVLPSDLLKDSEQDDSRIKGTNEIQEQGIKYNFLMRERISTDGFAVAVGIFFIFGTIIILLANKKKLTSK